MSRRFLKVDDGFYPLFVRLEVFKESDASPRAVCVNLQQYVCSESVNAITLFFKTYSVHLCFHDKELWSSAVSTLESVLHHGGRLLVLRGITSIGTTHFD